MFDLAGEKRDTLKIARAAGLWACSHPQQLVAAARLREQTRYRRAPPVRNRPDPNKGLDDEDRFSEGALIPGASRKAGDP